MTEIDGRALVTIEDDGIGLGSAALYRPLTSADSPLGRMVGVQAKAATERDERFGGTDGNETLTSAVAVVLTVLLIAEGITILRIGGLKNEHMFIGMVLIPPVLLKLGSTGYRFARYYLGTRAYRDKGPPQIVLRLLAPLLVLATLVVFATGVALLIVGHKSGFWFTVHKVSFIVWGVVFGVHFLGHLARMLGSLRDDWTREGRRRIPGAGIRALLVAAAIGGGVALAIVVLPQITGWHVGRG